MTPRWLPSRLLLQLSEGKWRGCGAAQRIWKKKPTHTVDQKGGMAPTDELPRECLGDSSESCWEWQVSTVGLPDPGAGSKYQKYCTFIISLVPSWTPSSTLGDPQSSHIIWLRTVRKKWGNSRSVCFTVMALPLFMSPPSPPSRCTNEEQTHYIAHRLCCKCRTWKASDSPPVN